MKRILVCAASRGIGYAVAKVFALDKANNIWIISSNKKNILKAQKNLKKHNKNIIASECDLSKKTHIEKLYKDIKKKWGGIDILFTNAGGPPSGPFEIFDDKAWQKSIELNLLSVIRLTRLFVKKMKEQKWGRIIILTSASTKQPLDNMVISNTLRAGLTGYAKTLANELAGYNITVNTVCPGFIDTQRIRELISAAAKQKNLSEKQIENNLLTQVPMKRFGKPEELANAVKFLASDEASFITGQAISVDGGFVKGLF